MTKTSMRALLAAALLASTATSAPAQMASGSLVWSREAPSGVTGFGGRVAPAGDVDGDGNDDVFVSGTSTTGALGTGASSYGIVFVLSGLDGTILRTFRGHPGHPSPALLEEAHPAGDFDHDGIPDFLLGAKASADLVSGEAGYLAIVSGRAACDGLALSAADCGQPADACVLLRVCGSGPGDTFGDRAAVVGDVNDDGVVDVLAGVPGASFAAPGEARLYSGANGSLIFSVAGAGAQDNLGAAVAGLGDITGDGVPDFAIGAPGAPKKRHPLAGALYLYSGADHTLRKTIAGKPFDMVGASVASAGLVNNDAIPDIVYGAPGCDRKSVVDAGQAVLVSGKNGKKLRKVSGTSAHLLMGERVIALGDVDGDGAGDFAAATPPNGLNGAYGRVAVYSGSCGCGLLIYDGPEANDGTGSSVGAVDVTGDGRAELVVGSPSSTSHPGGIVRVLSLQ